MIQLGYTILYVQDVVKTVEFYENAFAFQRKFIAPDNSYAELISGSTTLSFAAIDLAASNLTAGFITSTLKAKPFGIEIGMVTDDVPTTLAAAITAGATLLETPKTKPWGQIVAYVRDLDGFLIEICTPVG
ncbi:VOC family protein [Flavobacterium kingsejongi]|uniref:Glyoxalase n=1 Tax=Flavobacterium kingsejongi TaxID=1678728 RepID=A0A2S1LRH3_9FLAO|nr:VOC family protein [Flavobacterium kingsejongi]AWG26370.1 glyoxalase [Flavobacterium kingsejongi]